MEGPGLGARSVVSRDPLETGLTKRETPTPGNHPQQACANENIVKKTKN